MDVTFPVDHNERSQSKSPAPENLQELCELSEHQSHVQCHCQNVRLFHVGDLMVNAKNKHKFLSVLHWKETHRANPSNVKPEHRQTYLRCVPSRYVFIKGASVVGNAERVHTTGLDKRHDHWGLEPWVPMAPALTSRNQ